MTVLVCDLGGTNTRLAITRHGTIDSGSIHRYRNDDFTDFTNLLDAFMRTANCAGVKTSVIALAAPTGADVVRLTNRNWVISRHAVAAATGASEVCFLNDYAALAASLTRKADLPIRTLRPGKAVSTGPQLILGAGTGFNAACLLPETGQDASRILTAEAGHATFPAQGELERELWDWFSARHGRCSLDRILSGSGLVALYNLVCRNRGTEPLHHSADGITHCADGKDDESETACASFARILGRTAGDLALTFMATGGVTLAGGVVTALVSRIAQPDGAFMKAFLDKGRMREIMQDIPIEILTGDCAGLHGCVEWLNRFGGSPTAGHGARI